MKKILLVVSVCLLMLDSSAQTQRLILVEEFTNASCGPCALSNPSFNTLMTANASKVVAIRYHSSFPGYDPFYSQNPVQIGFVFEDKIIIGFAGDEDGAGA